MTNEVPKDSKDALKLNPSVRSYKDVLLNIKDPKPPIRIEDQKQDQNTEIPRPGR